MKDKAKEIISELPNMSKYLILNAGGIRLKPIKKREQEGREVDVEYISPLIDISGIQLQTQKYMQNTS